MRGNWQNGQCWSPEGPSGHEELQHTWSDHWIHQESLEQTLNYHSLGRSELTVSELCLGGMSFGWECNETVSRQILDRFMEAGGNFIDTADIYSSGESESIIGRWLEDRNRDEIVVATKVRFSMDNNHEKAGLGRNHILAAVEASLRRLRTDHIDLYQVHCWDSATPIEDTLDTLDMLVRSGKVRTIGVCNVTGWQLQRAIDHSRHMGSAGFVSLQALYNLLDRYLEWDLIPVCRNEGLGLMCWSPLAGGWLTGLIRPGMTAEVNIMLHDETRNSGYLVPIAAIAPGNNKDELGYVYIFDPETSTVRKTTIVLPKDPSGRQNNMVPIIEGISAGDVIAVAGVSFLSDGQKVRLMQP